MPSYVIITPARNEGQYLQQTIDCVTAQTLKPLEWIIVNDGSTDNTREIITAAEKQHPWIRGVHRADRGFRKAGGGVIEAFYEGYTSLAKRRWDFIVKFDGDLSFPPGYFASCLKRFESDPKLGLGGGTICNDVGGTLVIESEKDPQFHVRGATKIYRRACWKALGGLIKTPGWDTLDEFKANMLGWRTYSFPELKVTHHRIAGRADGAWKNWVKNGRANYVSGYHPLFMVLKCMQRLVQKPYGLAGAGLLTGFCSGYVRRLPQIDDEDLVKYVREQQMNRLLFRENLWNVRSPASPALEKASVRL
jgi:poly-beta-1,6-N-acetyl-D-glucosamine synthase